MTWREAEHLAAEHMRAIGFVDALATPIGADKGLDVVSTGGVAQVKHFSTAPVGSPDVQRLKGAGHDSSRTLFYSLTGYTAAASAFADSAGVALFIYSAHGTVSPVNRVAEALVDTGYVPLGFGTSTAARERLLSEFEAYGQATIDSVARLMNAVSDLATDTEWISNLTQEQYVDNIQPAMQEAAALQQLASTLNDEQPIGRIMTSIAQCEALAQQVAVRFDLNYGEFLPGASQPD